MKIYTILILMYMLCIRCEAQGFNKKLIHGNWSLYAMGGMGHTLTRDSLASNIIQVISAKKVRMPGGVISEKDSTELAAQLKNKFDQLFSTYARFDSNGVAAMLLGFDRDQNGKASEQTGTFIWSADNRITVQLGKSKPVTFIVIRLSTDKMMIASEDDKDGVMMRFKKVNQSP